MKRLDFLGRPNGMIGQPGRRRHRPNRLRPMAEVLEGRALMARAGSLDPTFNGTGYYLASTSANPSGLSGVEALAVESDGSAVVAGPVGGSGTTQLSSGLIHLTADGQLDSTFGTSGVATLNLPSGDSLNTLGTMLLGSQNQIFLVGTIKTAASTNVAFVAQFNANGEPEPTFGTDGLALLPGSSFGASTSLGGTYGALQSNGQIVVVGDLLVSGSTNNQEIGVIRLNTDGSIDTSFGTSGLETISSFTSTYLSQNPGVGDFAGGVAIQPNGQIVVVGESYIPANYPSTDAIYTPEIHRLDADGTLDDAGLTQAGFASTQINSPGPNGVIVEPNGDFLLYGLNISFQGQFPTLGLLSSDGTFINSVAAPGLSDTSLSDNEFALLPDGDIVATTTGYIQTATGSSPTFETERFLPDLSLDKTFGVAGVSNVVVPAPPSMGDPSGDLVAVSPTGQVILAGSTAGNQGITGTIPPDYAVVRITSTGSGVAGDYTGDGVADLAVYLPNQGVYAIRPSGGGPDEVIPFGIAGPGQSIPAPGDYFGTGVDDLAVYLPSVGSFAIRNPAGGADEIVPFGFSGEGETIPAPGDYFGTGQTDIAAYLPSIGAFAIRNPAGGPDEIIPFGLSGAGNSIPVPGDYDGSGKTELAVYLPSLGIFAYRPADGGPDQLISFGIAGAGNSIPVPGDYDQSGRTELAVYIPSLAEFIYRPAFGGGPDIVVPFGVAGAGQTIPAIGDYTGSGQDELAAYFPASGDFVYRPESPDTLDKTSTTGPPLVTGPDVVEQFGIPGTGNTIPITGENPTDFLVTPTVSAMSIGTTVDDLEFDPLDLLSPIASKKKAAD